MLTDRYFMPDRCFDDIYMITPEFLLTEGIRAVLLDIDNTLVTYDDPEPTEPVIKWLNSLAENGISAAFISNNRRERVERFNSRLGYFASWESKKPSGKNYIAAMKHLGTDRSNTAVIGDQIFTDVWSVKRLGLRAYLVKPIKDKLTPLFRFKRALEVPVLKRYAKKHGGKS